MRLVAIALIVPICATPSSSALAQDEHSASAEEREEALRVFLDCDDCDFDYFRAEITFVNYVRDREDAQVHILITTQPTGGGGTEFTINLIGLKNFSGANEVLRYASTSIDTEDEVRQGLAQLVKLALLRYVAETPLAAQIEVSHTAQLAPTGPADDAWNYWVFRSFASARFNGEESRTAMSFSGSFSADRTTEEWKIRSGINGQYGETSFELSDARIFTNVTRNFDATGLVVRSVSDHWGVGFGASATASTFVNQDLTLRLAPAVEYNIYPYEESTRRQFTFSYAVGVSAVNYEEETIFDKTFETLFDQTFTVFLDMKQPWGSTSMAVEAANFLHDPSKYRVVFFGALNLRVRRGLSFNIFASTSVIRDQLFLPKEALTDEEILVQRRQLATSYRYSLSFGITYTFGSIYNNVVNSRFAGASGGILRVF